MRNVFNLNRRTHRNLIEELSQTIHMKTAIFSRYLTFYKSLMTCSKVSVRYLARIHSNDNNSTMGKTLMYIAESCSIDKKDLLSLSSNEVKRRIKYSCLPSQDKWKRDICRELMEKRKRGINEVEMPGFSQKEINDMFENICIN